MTPSQEAREYPPLPEPAIKAAPVGQERWPFPRIGYYTAEQVYACIDADRKARQQDALQWRDAYAAFVGAFDTPQQRRLMNDEYSNDARLRLREFNEAFCAALTKGEQSHE